MQVYTLEVLRKRSKERKIHGPLPCKTLKMEKSFGAEDNELRGGRE